MTYQDDDDGLPDMSNKKMLRIIMQEIADVHRELREDISNLDKKLSMRMDRFEQSLGDWDQKLSRKIDNLNFKVDQNQIALMSNIDDHDGRLTVLEAKIA